MPSLGVYAGSFDPPTNGHVWMIRQGAAMFDRLIVAIGNNPAKKSAYSLEDRLAWLSALVTDLPNTQVTHFGNEYLAYYAKHVGAKFILRGVRSEADFAYEQAMRHINQDLNPDLTTVFVMPPREFGEVSSSLVRGLIGPSGWQDVVRRYVPDAVFKDLARRHA